MSTEAPNFLGAVAVGLGATLFMDLWALFLKHAFSIPSANYCLVGRWFCHMPEGTFMHASIANASQKRFECTVGWIAHYVIGVVYVLKKLAHRARWIVAQLPPSDAELDFLATGHLPGQQEDK